MTVLAPTAALADALSTAFYLLGPQAAARYVGHASRESAWSSSRTDLNEPSTAFARFRIE